jgi:sugar-phosphatase
MTIKAVIFDMDGVLIDSEPFWQRAEIEVFQSVGLYLTHEESAQNIGRRLDKVVEAWYIQRPWKTPPTVETVTQTILDHVIQQVQAEGEAKTGVYQTLDFLKTQQVKLAIASSSDLRLIEIVVERLHIASYFDILWSAQFEPYGKPHPAVYLTTAQQLGVAPEACLVIEDSLRGILAAKAAEMKCMAIPDESFYGDARLSIADTVIHTLTDFDNHLWEQLNTGHAKINPN